MRLPRGLQKILFNLTLSALIAIVIIARLPQATVAQTPLSFSDVSGHWAQPYIEALANQGFLAGYPRDTKYYPDKPITRAEYASILEKAFNPPIKREQKSFTDVPRRHWGYQAIQTAYRGGFLDGYPGNIFQPNQNIPREQVLVSLAAGLGLEPRDPNVLAFYSDSSAISDFATNAVVATTEQQIVVNYPTLNQLNPNRVTTRAEVAAFIHQALVEKGTIPPINPPPSTVVIAPVSVSQPGSGSGQNLGIVRPNLPPPSVEVEGTFQVLLSNLNGCNIGGYSVAGTFDPGFTKFTLSQAKGAEGCFGALPLEIFQVPALVDGGNPVTFESQAGPDGSRISGSVSRIYGSFVSPIAYIDAGETAGILSINSQNTVVRDPEGETITEKSTILTQFPIPELSGTEKVIDEMPPIISAPVSESEITLDEDENSDLYGRRVVRNQLRVVFSDDATVNQVNAALKSVGGGIVESYEGGTVVTIKIPDTGRLDGVARARDILAIQSGVITTVPIVLNEIPEPPTLDSDSFSLVGNQQGEFIPQFFRLIGAVDEDNEPTFPTGDNPVNLFIADMFSTTEASNGLPAANSPSHPDLLLLNPFRASSASKQHTEAGKETNNIANKGWLCDNGLRFACQQRIEGAEGTRASPPPNPDPDNNLTVALFRAGKPDDEIDKNSKERNSHGFLVSGLMAAQRGNSSGVVGLFPKKDTVIYAFNARRSDYMSKLLGLLQQLPGHHVVNFSIGYPYKRNKDGFLADFRTGKCSVPKDWKTCPPISNGDSETLNQINKHDWLLDGAISFATEVRQRQLEDRVVFVASAGNSSEIKRRLFARSEQNSERTAAALQDMVIPSRRKCVEALQQRHGTSIGGVIPTARLCREVPIERIVPRLRNVAVVEALDVIEANVPAKFANYADYSSIVSNASLSIRAFGDASVPCPIDPSVIGFPALTNNGGILCETGGGTSSAAPQVSGLAAWAWTLFDVDAPSIVNSIRNSQSPFPILNAEGEPIMNDNSELKESKVTAINVNSLLGNQ
jgi:hypothetical protein